MAPVNAAEDIIERRGHEPSFWSLLVLNQSNHDIPKGYYLRAFGFAEYALVTSDWNSQRVAVELS